MAVATDNFNRANGAVGSNWTQPPASSATLNVVSNQCGVSSTGVFCCGFWNASTFVADHYSQATIGTAATSGSEAVGLIVRAKTGTDEFYLGFVSDSKWQIYARSGGSYTLLTDTTAGSTSGDVIKLEATGTGPVVINLNKNGVLQTGYTTGGGDAIINGGSPGILILDSGNSLSLDDWEGGVLVAAAVYTKGNFLGFM